MGKIKQGILGGFSGKVGPVIGTSWKGKAVMRAQALSYNDANSEAQQQQRAKFSLVSKFLAAINNFINVGFNGKANGMTAPNAALQRNINDAITGTWPNFQLDFENFLVSDGKIDLPYNPQAQNDSGTLTVTWTDNTGLGDALADDKVMTLIYNKSRNISITNIDAAERSDRNATITFPTSWTGDSVEVYMAMYREDGRLTSKSTHLGTYTV